MCDQGLLAWTLATGIGFSILTCTGCFLPMCCEDRAQSLSPHSARFAVLALMGSQLWSVAGVVVLVFDDECRTRDPRAWTFVASMLGLRLAVDLAIAGTLGWRRYYGDWPQCCKHTPQPPMDVAPLPTRVHRSSKCSLCSVAFADREPIKTLPCRHKMHRRYAVSWASSGRPCPRCHGRRVPAPSV